MPMTLALQFRVAVPEPVTVGGAIALHVRPDGTVSERLTVPENPLRPVMVTWALRVAPTLTWSGETLERLKSTTLIVIVNGCESGPLVPTIVTW